MSNRNYTPWILQFAVLYLTMMCQGRTQLLGSIPRCNGSEGQHVEVPRISDDPCFSCICKNNNIECSKLECPAIEGCHMVLFDKPSDSCCHVCKGCLQRGQMHLSGTEWTDAKNPCRTNYCHAGVITTSVRRCQVTCANPVEIHGRCCPACQGCTLNGKTYVEGQIFASPRDGCATCTCKDGAISCERKACPVLSCEARYVSTPSGSCCPVCRNSRKLYDISNKRACLFRKSVKTNGTTSMPDPCTQCICMNGTMLCQRQVCPPLDCLPDFVLTDRKSCCPRCEKPKNKCKFKSKQYKHGDVWKPDVCTDCNCDDGTVSCQVEQCHNSLECPRNQKLRTLPGRCCPECVDDEAVCSVFGDPHYRTFDGRIYNFQGTCNYILAQDCLHRNFSIRVRNDARMTTDFAWTKSVRIYMLHTKVSLMQKLKVKVNKRYVTLPYYTRDKFVITQSDNSVTVKTTFGVKVVWDGDSYLEVVVPPIYKGRMCGLCGDFNNYENDDFRGRDGNPYFDADDFGDTWRVGQRKACQKRHKPFQRDSPCKRKSRRIRVQKACSKLHSPIFSECVKRIPVDPYYTSCITDMCECPSLKRNQCYCESLTAYARECQRDGVTVEWRTPGTCGAPSCPKKAILKHCASACPRSCDNWYQPIICDKPCSPGCECPPGRVLHQNKCIQPRRCPDYKNQRLEARKMRYKSPGS